MATPQATKLLQEVARAFYHKKGFAGWFEKVKVVSGGNGTCVCEMTIDNEHLNAVGHLHGGCAATLVDMVSSLALITTPQAFPGVTVDLNVSIMRPGKKGDDIIIDAKTSKAGRSMAFLTVEIKRKEDGKLLATGSHTKFVEPRVADDNFAKLQNHL